MTDKTLTFILAGGVGSRLYPLTHDRTKPAVPFGGKYRIIDFSLANCLHSGLRQILVLTQYKSHSLHKHLRDGWSIFNPEVGEYITVVPPQMRASQQWYLGTADAIWQNRYLIERSQADSILVLSGDHIYRMDYAAMITAHRNSAADVTIACMKTSVEEAKAFGVINVDEQNKVVDFQEKPENPATMSDDPAHCLVSMGIYVFNKKWLLEILQADSIKANSDHDFGKNIFPSLLNRFEIATYQFGGNSGRVSQDQYWRDVGTIESYYQANMNLLAPVPSLDLYQEDWPIRSYQPQTPPARTVPSKAGNEGIFINSILAGGTVISGGCVQHSILFPNIFVGDESVVSESIIFDRVHIGANVELSNCIIDKNTVIPDNTRIGFDREKDAAKFTVTDSGVVVVPKAYDFSNY